MYFLKPKSTKKQIGGSVCINLFTLHSSLFTVRSTTSLCEALHHCAQHYITVHSTTSLCAALHHRAKHYITVRSTTSLCKALHHRAQHYITVRSTTSLCAALHHCAQHYITGRKRYIHFETCIQNECDIFALQMRYYLAMRDSDIFAFGECGGKYANINPHAAQFAAYRAAGISLAIRQISQIREDLYRFSLSASSDKLNFPRALTQ